MTYGHDGDGSPSRTTLPLDDWNAQIEASARTIGALRACIPAARAASAAICGALEAGHSVLTCGNGGSSLEAQHFASELISHFKRDRRALPAIALPLDHGVVTAIANDYSYAEVFARQVSALAAPGDVVLGFSTSGDSENVLRALQEATRRGATTVAFVGGAPGRIATAADHVLRVESTETARVQEGHLVLTHVMCDEIDAYFTQ